jgi:Icc-related predicted phosphoesterase
MKIYHISDTHTYHDLLNIPEDIDLVIHSGDCSNPRDPYTNEPEVRNFIHWFKSLPIKHKIYVAGNHDCSIEKKLVTKKDFEGYNIIYLENDYVTIEGLKIFGSPHTPNFGNWAFMKDRSKLNRVWEHVDEGVDIFIVHGPPKGVLDLSYSRDHILEFCGCSALRKQIVGRIKPKLVCFGHIHSTQDIQNNGVLYQNGIYFSNGSVVTDGKFGKLTSNGNIFEIDNNKNIKINYEKI